MTKDVLIFMSFGDLKGNSTDPQHHNWIELISCSFTSGRNMEHGQGPQLIIHKKLDAATSGMFSELFERSERDCAVHFCLGDGFGNTQPFLEYELHGAWFHEFDTVLQKHVGSSMVERYVLNFSSIQGMYFPLPFTAEVTRQISEGRAIGCQPYP